MADFRPLSGEAPRVRSSVPAAPAEPAAHPVASAPEDRAWTAVADAMEALARLLNLVSDRIEDEEAAGDGDKD